MCSVTLQDSGDQPVVMMLHALHWLCLVHKPFLQTSQHPQLERKMLTYYNAFHSLGSAFHFSILFIIWHFAKQNSRSHYTDTLVHCGNIQN